MHSFLNQVFLNDDKLGGDDVIDNHGASLLEIS